jgi:hypothetical protein
MIEQYLTIFGYWKDSKEPIERLCKIDSRMNPHHKDHQEFIEVLDDDTSEVFYYFEPDEPIVGDHSDFIVYKFEIEGVNNDVRY